MHCKKRENVFRCFLRAAKITTASSVFAVHCTALVAEKVAGVAGEIGWCQLVKDEVLEAVKQFQLAQGSNNEVMNVRNVRCRKIWTSATNYDKNANTMVNKVTSVWMAPSPSMGV